MDDSEGKERHSFVVVLINTSGQSFKCQVEIYLVLPLVVSVEDKTFKEFTYNFNFFVWSIVFAFFLLLITEKHHVFISPGKFVKDRSSKFKFEFFSLL